MAIDTVERKSTKDNPGGVIVIKCKDFRIIMLGIDNTEHFNCVAQSLEDIVKMGKKLPCLYNKFQLSLDILILSSLVQYFLTDEP